jgi:xanthine dehydrogenase YagT iron-sulfur-binding subunit
MLEEFTNGIPSTVTPIGQTSPELSDEELRERMSGNLCRCGAYIGIRDAIREVHGGMSK